MGGAKIGLGPFGIVDDRRQFHRVGGIDLQAARRREDRLAVAVDGRLGVIGQPVEHAATAEGQRQQQRGAAPERHGAATVGAGRNRGPALARLHRVAHGRRRAPAGWLWSRGNFIVSFIRAGRLPHPAPSPEHHPWSSTDPAPWCGHPRAPAGLSSGSS